MTRQQEEVVTSTEVSHTRISASASALPRRIKWDLATDLFVVLAYGKRRLTQEAAIQARTGKRGVQPPLPRPQNRASQDSWPSIPPRSPPATHCRTPAASPRSRSGPMTARGTACGGCGPRRPAPRQPRAGPRPPAAHASTRPATAPAAAAPKPAAPRRTPPSWPPGRRRTRDPTTPRCAPPQTQALPWEDELQSRGRGLG